MGGKSVKTIVLLMVLVVLSVLVGAQVTDGFKDSIGAFGLIGGVVALFLLLWMGKNSWWLMFLLPPFLVSFPLRFVDAAIATFMTSFLVFIYHYIQCKSMGFARLRWHSMFAADLLMVLIAIYMVASYCLHPVALDILDMDMDFVGGRVYIYAAGAIFYYFSLSMLDAKQIELERLLKIAFWVQLIALILNVIIRLKSGAIYWGGEETDASYSETFGQSRVVVFAELGYNVLVFCFASLPFFALLRSPMYLFGSLVAMVGIVLSGARSYMVEACLSLMGPSMLRREFSILALMGCVFWVMLVGLSRGGGLEDLPYTTQRFFAMVPGVRIDREIATSTQASSAVRLIAWKQAFDPSNGYISDYIWGDGFQLSKSGLNRSRVAHMRGTIERIGMNNNRLAITGNWHNGFIFTMHRLGLVGCVIFYLVFFISLFLFFRVGRYYVGKPLFPYYCVFSIQGFNFPFVYSYNSRTPMDFFFFIVTFSLLKIMYSVLRENGELRAFSLRHHYTPMTISELEQSRKNMHPVTE